MFEYLSLEGVAYHVLRDSEEITSHLRHWLRREWLNDLGANSHETWTQEWLSSLDQLQFHLRVMNLSEICINQNLMAHEDAEGPFVESLERRAVERIEALDRGVSFEPLTVRASDRELMDGYTRHRVLRQRGIEKVYVYWGESVL